jgi:TonB family protein
VVRSQPAGVFDAAAISTARTWYVHPPIENGVPVARRWRTQIDFLPDEPKQD